MRSHRRRLPIDHVLIAGGAEDLDAIRALLPFLPPTAYGQILLEVDEGTDLSDLAAPARVTTTCLRRPAGPHRDRSPELVMARKGALLTDAVAAWVAEWIPEEPVIERLVTMWVGSRECPSVNALCARLAQAPERL